LIIVAIVAGILVIVVLVFVIGSKQTRENSAESTESEDEEATTTSTERPSELECENRLTSELEVMDSTLLSDGNMDENLSGFM
jgi:flagellar basal body-associated protein FliL